MITCYSYLTKLHLPYGLMISIVESFFEPFIVKLIMFVFSK